MFDPKFTNTHTISSDCSHFWSEYYDAIQSVRENEMDMTTWLEYFTEGLSSQLAEMKTKGEKAIKWDALSDRKSQRIKLECTPTEIFTAFLGCQPVFSGRNQNLASSLAGNML